MIQEYRCLLCEGKPFTSISKHLIKKHIFEEHEHKCFVRTTEEMDLSIPEE